MPAKTAIYGGAQYNRKLNDALAVQQEIAEEISGKLRTGVMSAEKARLHKSSGENAEAHQLYLLGRYQVSKGSADGLQKAVESFQQAINKSPGDAMAYAGLAYAYDLQGGLTYLSPGETFPKAKAAATKALEIDDSVADAHA